MRWKEVLPNIREYVCSKEFRVVAGNHFRRHTVESGLLS